MQILTCHDAIALLSKSTGKCILYLSGLFPPDDIDDNWFKNADGAMSLMAAPFIDTANGSQHIYHGIAIILCDSRAEMINNYNLVYGEDGRTAKGDAGRKLHGYPIYGGDHRVYAATCVDGEWQTENT